MEFTLLGAALVSVGAVWATLRLADEEERRPLFDTALGGILAGVAVGRVWAMIASGVNPIAHPGDLVVVRGGVDTVAATAAAVITVGYLGRKALWPTLDALALPALAGLSAWHASCVLRDSCLGTVTDLPWGIAASAGGHGRHPVEIYAALLLLGSFAVVALLLRRHRGSGLPAAAALMLAAGARLGTEPLRPVLAGLEPWYLAAVALGAVLVGWRWAARPAEQP